MFNLKNDLLEISIHPLGAELQKITSTKFATEFMWDGDPDVWRGHSPNLFPIVGALKNNEYVYENTIYHLSRHGFVRHDHIFSIADKTEHQITFKLEDSEDTYEIYPFRFMFLISYALEANTIKISYTVKNTDDKKIYFSVGGHPAFKCPLFEDERYDDYSLHFEHPENSQTHLLNLETGLFTGQTEPVFHSPQNIPLRHDLFDKDALVFKDLKSDEVSLKSNNHGEILKMTFKDFPYLGIWAKPKGNFVCIEPWQGLADSEDTNQIFKDKEGIVALDAGKEYTASYHIEIHKSHLV